MKKFLLLLIIAIAGLTQSTFGQTFNLGTGSVSGIPAAGTATRVITGNDITYTTSGTILAGTYNCINFTVNTGVILTVTGTSAPLIIRCTGTFTNNGTINAAGGIGGTAAGTTIGAAGVGVAGGTNGGAGGNLAVGGNATPFGTSSGNGLGGATSTTRAAGGGGGGYGASGARGFLGNGTQTGGQAGLLYGNATLTSQTGAAAAFQSVGALSAGNRWLLGGSGGGGGGSRTAGLSQPRGGGGGAGGGAIQITANSVTIGSQATAITVRGGNGGGSFDALGASGGAGGGGAGGTINVQYVTSYTNGVSADANLIIAGGTGGTAYTSGGNNGRGGDGAVGRRLVEQDVILCTQPTTGAGAITGSNVQTTTADINFTRGNGTGGVIVLARAGSAVNASPLSGTTYTANSAFGSGSQIGTGNFVVYIGTGNGISTAMTTGVTGLIAGTAYHFSAFEYNTTSTCYTSTGGIGNLTTANCSGTPPTATPVATPATICSGASTTLSLTGLSQTYTYQWQISTSNSPYSWSDVGGATNSTLSTGALSTTRYYRCNVTCLGNTTASNPVTVNVNALPTVTVSPNTNICHGGAGTSLTAGGASTYTWSPTTGLSPTSGAVVTANPTATQAYVVTGTDGFGCQNTANVTVTVNMTAAAITPSTASIGIGGSTSLTASATNPNGSVTYSWSPATGLSATTGATVTASPLSTTTYMVTATDGAGCSKTATVTVTVNSGTSGSVNCGYTFGYTTATWAAVSGGTVLGTGNASPGPTDDVSYANQSIGFNFDYNGITYSTLGVNTNCFVWFGATTPGGNSYIPISTTQSMEGVISIMGQDMIGNAAGSTVSIQTTGTSPNRVCIIQWNNFRAYSGSSRGDYQIRLYETTNVIELRYNHQPYPIFDTYTGQVGLRGTSNTDYNNRSVISCSNNWNTSTAGGANNVTCQVDGVTCSTYPATNAVFRFTPNIATPTITPTGTQNICLGGPGTTLTANTTVSSPAYQWLLAGSNIGGATTSTYLANPSPAGNYFYSVRVTNGSGCSRTSYATAVVVNPAPSVPTGLTSQTRCGGSGTVTFTVADPGVGNTIEWSNDGSTANGSVGLTYSPNINVGTPVNVYARAKTTVSGCTSAWTNVATGTAYNNPAAPTITPSGSTAICTGGNIDLTSSYTTGNVWSTTATTQTINVNTAGSFTVTYTDGNNCSATSATTTTTLISCGPMQWTGASSTNWDTPGNWTPAGPPTASTDIQIPNVANDPVISLGGNAACKDVDISSGATILVDAGKTLDIKGEWTGANNTVSGGGKTIFSGTASAQTITGGATFSTLQINNSNGTTIASGGNFVNVTKALELKAGVLTTNGNLKTKSTSSAATAYIDDFSSGFTGSVSGVVSVERFIPPSPSGFRYVGQPVNTGAGIMAISAMEGFTVTGQPGQTIPLPTCSPTFTPLNVAINSPYGNLMYYQESGPFGSPACRQRGWWFQTTGSLTVGRGYGIKQSGNTVITFKGNVNTGTITATNASTYTNVWSQAGDNGWNLVSNPFPSAITLNNTDGISQLSDNPATSNNMPYGYTYALQFYITGNSTQTGSYVVRNVLTQPTDIALGQGFWVRVDPAISSSATWKLGHGHRITSAPTYYDVNPTIESHLNVKVLGNNMEDVSDIYFIGAADNDLDLYDGNKWESATGHPTLYTKASSEVMGINSLPSLTETKVVPMGLKPGTNGNYTFTFDDVASFPQTAMIYLEDLKLGTMNNLRANNTYTFAADVNDSPDRFMLHFQLGLQAEVADQDCDSEGTIELTQLAPTVWSTYEVKGNDNNVYATGTNLSGTVTVSNLPAQEYVVTVTHPSGYSAQEYITVNGSNPISASINASSTLVMVDEMVTLTANATNASEYVWNFGDGNTQTGSANVVHAYDAEGTYNVTLTASNSDCNSETTKIIKVNNTATGLNGTAATNLNIYGQGERVVIEFNKWGGDKADIFMYNTLGQRMESLTGVSTLKGRQELSISDIKPGYYFIQVVSNGKVLGKKVFLGKQ